VEGGGGPPNDQTLTDFFFLFVFFLLEATAGDSFLLLLCASRMVFFSLLPMRQGSGGRGPESSVAAQHGQRNHLRPLLQPHLHRLRRVACTNERKGIRDRN
jgi:hypothetical protein